jgi:pimeloyl-ACP methyl ester carboxylesterase
MKKIERIEFRNSRGLRLIGDLQSAGSKAIVIMAPGSCSDRASQGRFGIIARALNEQGISTLAIDFSGCGESDDDAITVAQEADDLRHSVNKVKALAYEKIAFLGHSLGGLASLRAYTDDIRCIAMYGGLCGPVPYKWDEMFSAEQRQEMVEKGYATVSSRNNMFRKENRIDKMLIEEINTIDQKELFKLIKCPLLMIHGDDDWEEQEMCKFSKIALGLSGGKSKLHIIRGAGHSFWGYIAELRNMLLPFLVEHLD